MSKTKTRLLLVAFTLIFLGFWAFPESRPVIPYYQETVTELRKLSGELQQKSASARTSSYGIFVEHNIATIGGIYGLIGLLMLLKRSYRNAGWESLVALCIGLMAFVVWFMVAFWISTAGREMRITHGETLFTGLIHPLVTIALGLSVWIGIPLFLLILLISLPGILYDILRLLVRLPFLIYHHLHYLTVPHPGETAYRAGMAKNLPMPELARTVSDAMYQYELKDLDTLPLPKAWKSKNWKKRIDAFHDRLKAEDRFMEELIKNLRLKSQFRE